jgi:hypothetical protein
MRRVKVATVGGGLPQHVLVDVPGEGTAAAGLGGGHEWHGANPTPDEGRNQSSSEVISGHQRPSKGTVPTPHIGSSTTSPGAAIRCNQRPLTRLTSDRAPRPPAPRPPAAASDTLSMSEAARCNRRRVVGVGARAPCCTSWTYLMRATIRGHQRSSEVIRGHQRSSEVIRGQERSSEVIRGH